MVHFSTGADKIFRKALLAVSTRYPEVFIQCVYATNGLTSAVDASTLAKIASLEERLAGTIPNVSASVALLGAEELLDLAQREKTYTLQLKAKASTGDEDGYVALVELTDYFDFITDDKGALRKYIFEWNVRDFEGRVQVNRDIAGSLEDPESAQFWWLNNGITVLCSEAAQTAGNRFTLDDVQVVNGLQTSVTLFETTEGRLDPPPIQGQAVIVKIIKTADPEKRDAVIRATNNQTKVQPASLRATDSLQRNIEQFFLTDGWFYERRKNYYKNQSKPTGRLITITGLAQAVSAIGFSDPSFARARPSDLVKTDEHYARIFNDEIQFETYLWMARSQRGVDQLIATPSAATTAAERTNLRFHVSTLVASRKAGERIFHPSQLKSVQGTEFGESDVLGALEAVKLRLGEFMSGHADQAETEEKVVKNRAFTTFLLDAELD